MNFGELITIKSLDAVSSEKRTPYLTEIRLFSCIQQGDLPALMKQIREIGSEITAGHMSEDAVMQYKYMAVSVITLATRYAIQGGLNENRAYAFSDAFIKTVDNAKTKDEILFDLGTQMIALTELVAKSKAQPQFSPHIRKSIAYIHAHFSERITVKALADDCGVSADYLSRIFKKEMGESVSSFVMRKKITAAKESLAAEKTAAEIARRLGFSSASHFGKAFKAVCGLSPAAYVSNIRNAGNCDVQP